MIDFAHLPPGEALMLAGLNFGVCSLICWSCVCRIGLMSESTTRLRFRASYVCLLVAASSSGLSPVLWGEWPGPGQLGMALAALYSIGAGYGGWVRGVPSYARSRPADFDDAPQAPRP